MGDRVYVSVTVQAAAHELSVDELVAYRRLTDGEVVNFDPVGYESPLDDESSYNSAGQAMTYFGAAEVNVGYMSASASQMVDLMRLGTIPTRSFSAFEDGDNGAGWLVEYSAEDDRYVEGSAIEGEFILSLSDILRMFEEHHRDGNAMVAALLHDYARKLPVPRSHVVDVIDKINKQRI